MLRPYETVLIFDSALSDEEIQERMERFSGILSDGEPDKVTVTPWGRRKLAYPIQKKEQGVYMILRHESEPAALVEFERVARLDEQLLRLLTIVNPIEAEPHAVAVEAAAPTQVQQSAGSTTGAAASEPESKPAAESKPEAESEPAAESEPEVEPELASEEPAPVVLDQTEEGRLADAAEEEEEA